MSEDNIERTNGETVVEWHAPLGGKQTVRVNPYTAKVTVNGREFDISSLGTQDVPGHLYREVDEENRSAHTGVERSE